MCIRDRLPPVRPPELARLPRQCPRSLDLAHFLEGTQAEDFRVFFPAADGHFHEEASLLEWAVLGVFAAVGSIMIWLAALS